MTSPTTRSPSLRIATLAVLLAAAACSGNDAAGPRDDQTFDASLARTEMQAIDGFLGATAWESFAALSPSFGLAPVATAAVAAAGELAVQVPTSPLEARSLATASAERIRAVAAANEAANEAGLSALPPGTLGTTFTWDAAERRYVAAPGRAGAPANGVRFVLYAVNPLTKEPVVAAEIGHADLTDVGLARPFGIGLRLEVVSGTTTFLDYTVIADGFASSGSLSVVGFLTDGITRLNFNVAARGTSGPAGGTGAVDFDFDVVDHGFGATGSVRVTDGSNGQVDLVVRVRDARIRFAVTGDAQTVNASVFLNDRLFATVTGDPGQVVVRGAGGRELRPDEAQALGQMLGLADLAFRVLGELLKPVEAIFALRSVP